MSPDALTGTISPISITQMSPGCAESGAEQFALRDCFAKFINVDGNRG